MNERRRSGQSLLSHTKTILLVITLITGITILLPVIDFQTLLSTGDHGRDLYAFNAARQGLLPYKNFWWVYGPLMPFYYGFAMSLLGASIKTVLVAKVFLTILGGLFIFLTLSLFISPILSFAAALWFYLYLPDFFFTYNHIGGILAILAVFYNISLYIKEQRISRLYAGLLFTFLLCLIKINFGIIALIMILLSRFLVDTFHQTARPSSKKFYILSCFILPLCVFSIYALLCFGLTSDEIRQCFPYLGADQQHHPSWLMPLQQLWALKRLQYFSTSYFQIITTIFFLCLLSLPYILKKYSTKKTRRETALFSVILAIFYILNLHEYFLSGVVYRSFWSSPFEVIFLFFIIGTAAAYMSQWTQHLLQITLTIFLLLQSFQAGKNIAQTKQTDHFLNDKRTQVYVGNKPAWIKTVKETTDYIFDHLGFQEEFFALPYDPIYYYLTDRISPTRQLIFFDHLHIAPAQEKNIIANLDAKNINWIIMSNRISSAEPGLGQFGRSYCPLLFQYIKDNFTSVAQFGDWSNEPGWAWNYGTKILKRIGYEPTAAE